MALIFPLAMPLIGPASEYFEPETVDYLSPRTDGRLASVTAGFPLWRGRWSLSRVLSREGSEEWRAFVAALRGSQRTFLARDYGRPFPLSAPNGFAGLSRAGGGAFDGTAGWALNSDRDQPTWSGLPASFRLSVGDYGMWRWTTGGEQRRALVRCVEAVTATAGGIATVQVEPPAPTVIPAGAVFDLARPCCVMRSVPGETKLGEKARTLRVDGTIVGLQDLRA